LDIGRKLYRVAEQPEAAATGPFFTVRPTMPAVTGLPSESGTTSLETSNSLSGHFGDRQVRWSRDPDPTTNVWLSI